MKFWTRNCLGMACIVVCRGLQVGEHPHLLPLLLCALSVLESSKVKGQRSLSAFENEKKHQNRRNCLDWCEIQVNFSFFSQLLIKMNCRSAEKWRYLSWINSKRLQQLSRMNEPECMVSWGRFHQGCQSVLWNSWQLLFNLSRTHAMSRNILRASYLNAGEGARGDRNSVGEGEGLDAFVHTILRGWEVSGWGWNLD